MRNLSKIISPLSKSGYLLNPDGKELPILDLRSSIKSGGEVKQGTILEHVEVYNDQRSKSVLVDIVVKLSDKRISDTPVDSITVFTILQSQYLRILDGTIGYAVLSTDGLQLHQEYTGRDMEACYHTVSVEDVVSAAKAQKYEYIGGSGVVGVCLCIHVECGEVTVIIYLNQDQIDSLLLSSGCDGEELGIGSKTLHEPDYKDLRNKLDMYYKSLKRLPPAVKDGDFIGLFGYLINELDNIVTKHEQLSENMNGTVEKVSNMSESREREPENEKYGLTVEQYNKITDMCDAMNITQLMGTGIQAVPIWYKDRVDGLMELNEHLQSEALAVQQFIEKMGTLKPNDLLDIPTRSNIYTGNTTPYVPGVTGPRIGDEHLDVEHYYNPTAGKGKNSRK